MLQEILFCLIILILAAIVVAMAAPRAIVGGASIFFQKYVDKYKDRDHFSLRDEPSLSVFLDKTLGDEDFWFTREGIYSMTPPAAARKISKIILDRFSGRRGDYGEASHALTITDATAGIGGNSLIFARDFARVIAVEINPQNYIALEHNAGIFGAGRVETILGDYLEIGHELHQDAVFIDPPWGGLDYADRGLMSLELSGVPLAEVVCKIPCDVFLKLPLNFDSAAFARSMATTRRIHITKFPKFLLIWISAPWPNAQVDPLHRGASTDPLPFAIEPRS